MSDYGRSCGIGQNLEEDVIQKRDHELMSRALKKAGGKNFQSDKHWLFINDIGKTNRRKRLEKCCIVPGV